MPPFPGSTRQSSLLRPDRRPAPDRHRQDCRRSATLVAPSGSPPRPPPNASPGSRLSPGWPLCSRDAWPALCSVSTKTPGDNVPLQLSAGVLVVTAGAPDTATAGSSGRNRHLTRQDTLTRQLLRVTGFEALCTRGIGSVTIRHRRLGPFRGVTLLARISLVQAGDALQGLRVAGDGHQALPVAQVDQAHA